MQQLFPNYSSVSAKYTNSTDETEILLTVAGFDENGAPYVVHDNRLILAKDVTFLTDVTQCQFNGLTDGFSLHETVTLAVQRAMPYERDIVNSVRRAIIDAFPEESFVLEALYNGARAVK